MNTVDNTQVISVKRGRPRRLEARVVGGDDLISALVWSGCVACGRRACRR